jgi:tRNA dimethylallyltransferase
VDIDRDSRRARISQRLKRRFDEGMLDEVKGLLDSGIPAEDLIYYGLEYKFMTLHLTGQMTFDQMFSELETAIHQFAKRQMTWFRGMERRGFLINWLPWDMDDTEFVEQARRIIDSGRGCRL